MGIYIKWKGYACYTVLWSDGLVSSLSGMAMQRANRLLTISWDVECIVFNYMHFYLRVWVWGYMRIYTECLRTNKMFFKRHTWQHCLSLFSLMKEVKESQKIACLLHIHIYKKFYKYINIIIQNSAYNKLPRTGQDKLRRSFFNKIIYSYVYLLFILKTNICCIGIAWVNSFKKITRKI